MLTKSRAVSIDELQQKYSSHYLKGSVNKVNSLAPKVHGLDPVLQSLNKQNNIKKMIIIVIIIIIIVEEELKKSDRKTRKFLMMANKYHPNASVHRLYIPKRAGGRGLVQLGTAYKATTTIGLDTSQQQR